MNLEQLKWQLNEYAKTPASKRVAERLLARLAEENQDNVIAFLPTRQVDLNEFEFELSELQFGEDYEVSQHWTADVPNEKGGTTNETLEDYERTELMENLDAEIEDLEGKLKRTKKEEKKLEHLRAVHEAWENAESEYDELYYDWGWSPGNDSVDEALAQRLGFNIIKFLTGAKADESFMQYGGGGMDMTPRLVAYNALKYGVVDFSHTHYFSGYRLADLRSGLSTADFNDMIDKLGVKRQVELAMKKYDKEVQQRERQRVKRERELARRKKKRPSAALRAFLAALPPPKDGPWTFGDVYTEVLVALKDKKLSKTVWKEFISFSNAFHRLDAVAELVGVTVPSYQPPEPTPEPAPAETPAPEDKTPPAPPSSEPTGE